MLTVFIPEPTDYEEILAEVLETGPSHGMWPDGERYHKTPQEAAKAIHESCVRTCNAWKQFAKEVNK